MIELRLEEAERIELEEVSACHRHDDIRRRARGLLALGKGYGSTVVAEVLGVSSQSVRNWAQWWKQRGLPGILGGHQGGRPAKLTAEMLETGRQLACQQPMLLREIAAGIRAAHPEAPSFSLDRLAIGLKARGLSFKRTRLGLKNKRDPAAFAQASETLSALRQAARQEEVDLFYLDGAGFSTLPSVQRAWAPLGQTHAADAGLGRKRLSVLGALQYGPEPRLYYESVFGSVRSDNVVGFLDRLAAQTDSTRISIVVLDNASVHHAIPQEKRDQWLIEHRLLLYFLPPYSPELNLIEIVWKHAKYHWRRFVAWSADRLQPEVHALLDAFGSKYKICFA